MHRMIAFKSVSKRYSGQSSSEKPALDDISFSVDPGEVFGYIGPNGAGKTTTIKILVGLIRDFQGSVVIAGANANSTNSSHPLHRLVGYMPQSTGFQLWRTVTHTLETFGRLSGLESPDLERRIEEVIERVGLVEYRKTRLTHLSGGTLQRLRLAQAILHEPKVLVLDEPMSGLDPASRFKFKTVIRELADENRLVFFSSHILGDVEDLATRIGIISGGKIQRTGTPSELRKEFSLGQIVELELSESAPEFDPTDFALDSIEQCNVVGSGIVQLHIKTGHDLDESIRDIMRGCLNRSIPIRRLHHVRPSLEQVYLNLTGETDKERSE
jgi:ABC-2 type transport system ATP-binding protein